MLVSKGKSAVTDHDCWLSSEPYEGFNKHRKQWKTHTETFTSKQSFPTQQHGRSLFISHRTNYCMHLLTWAFRFNRNRPQWLEFKCSQPFAHFISKTALFMLKYPTHSVNVNRQSLHYVINPCDVQELSCHWTGAVKLISCDVWRWWLMNKRKSHAACKRSRAAGLQQHQVILTALMNGRFRIEPRTGILLMKPITTGKKPLDAIKGKEREREWVGERGH